MSFKRIAAVIAAIGGIALVSAAALPASAAPAHVASAKVAATSGGGVCGTLIANQVSNGTSRQRISIDSNSNVIVAYYPYYEYWCVVDQGGGLNGLEAYTIHTEVNGNPTNVCLGLSAAFSDEIVIQTCHTGPIPNYQLFDIQNPPGMSGSGYPNTPIWIHNEYTSGCLQPEQNNLLFIETCGQQTQAENWSQN